jgi:acetyl-CoA synthetase
VNFARDLFEAADPKALAVVEITRDGKRQEWTFAEIAGRTALAASAIAGRGVRRGDIVMTLVGNRPEWVISMMACFRLGAVALPCTEQLRAHDLRMRIDAVRPQLVIADVRNRAELEAALGDDSDPDVLAFPDDDLYAADGDTGYADLSPDDPCLITFTSGTSGEPKPVLHGQRYLTGQRVQAEHWLGPEPGDLVWCTASSGWSKSARNVFIAPWLREGIALLHDARFDAEERLQILTRERVNVLCMAPTEYRVIAKRATLHELPGMRQMVAAGEALNPEVLGVWREATGLDVRDGYGQTETGQLTANPVGRPARPGSMGLPLPGVRLRVDGGELVADPGTIPTYFLGYGEFPAPTGLYRTGDRVIADEEGYLYFEGRTDDVIVSAGYRIGPFEVESALVSHPAVAEAAVVASPDDERGNIVRAVVVLQDPDRASARMAEELQDFVKARTAPYKYPRVVDFQDELPKTSSGKIQRALLRAQV